MADPDTSLDLFEEFCRICRDNDVAKATLGGMSVEFAPPTPPVAVSAYELPPLTNDGPPAAEAPAPVTRQTPYHRLFKSAVPGFQRKD